MKNQHTITKTAPIDIKSWTWYQALSNSLLHSNDKAVQTLLSEGNISFRQAYIWTIILCIVFQFFYSTIIWIKFPSPINIGSISLLLINCLLAGLIFPVSIIMLTGFIHILVKLFGHKGTFQNFFISYIAYNARPMLLYIVLALIWQVFRIEIVLYLSVLLSIYLLFVPVTKAIKVNYRFNWLEALLLGFFAQVAFSLSFFVLFIILNPSITKW